MGRRQGLLLNDPNTQSNIIYIRITVSMLRAVAPRATSLGYNTFVPSETSVPLKARSTCNCNPVGYTQPERHLTCRQIVVLSAGSWRVDEYHQYTPWGDTLHALPVRHHLRCLVQHTRVRHEVIRHEMQQDLAACMHITIRRSSMLFLTYEQAVDPPVLPPNH